MSCGDAQGLTRGPGLWITHVLVSSAAPAAAFAEEDFHTSTGMTPDLWQRGCERLASELPEQQFNTWIRPLPPAELLVHGDPDKLTQVVRNLTKNAVEAMVDGGALEVVLLAEG